MQRCANWRAHDPDQPLPYAAFAVSVIASWPHSASASSRTSPPIASLAISRLRSNRCGAIFIRLRHADRTAHARAAQAAIAPRVLGEILLVILLGVVELGRQANLRGDRAVPGSAQALLVALPRGFGDAQLRFVGRINR